MQLTLACMKAIEPQWTEEDATRALHRAFLLEHPDTYAELPISADLVAEVVTNVEARTVKEYAADLERLQAKRKYKVASREALMQAHFGVKPVAKAKPKAKPKPCPRWQPRPKDKVQDATAFIQRHKPESVAIVTDEANGRWLLVSQDKQRRSLSWTKRGLAAATAEVLHAAWTFHIDGTGENPPFRLEELLTHASQEAAA